jgi:hypothetical protein
MTSLGVISEDNLDADIKLAIDKFIMHYVWHSKDPASENPIAPLKDRLQTRYEEMRQRRKRLVRSIYKREGKLAIFEESYIKMAQQKMNVLKNFNGKKLEDMLRTSTKNVAQEVVSILINHSRDHAYGVLPDIEKNYLKLEKQKPVMKQRIASANRKGVYTAELRGEVSDGEDDENKEEEEVPNTNVLASSCSVNVNKFSNISDFNKKLGTQHPQIPPTVNYNNYFNHTKYRYNSKSRKTTLASSNTSAHGDSKPRVKTANRSESSNNPRKNTTMGVRRNSLKGSDSEYVRSTKPSTKTSRHEIVDQK